MASTFLQAHWRRLAMANYSIDKDLLLPYLPAKTELDLWNDTCYVSLVGFRFLDTRLKGIPVPFHTRFEEVNLRFYVRHLSKDGWKRGVVFIKEIAPKPVITFVANTFYGENYETMPMRHTWKTKGERMSTEYWWKKKRWNSFSIATEATLQQIRPGSEEEFITEHYWGYTKLKNGGTAQYEVTHPKWDVYPVREYHIDVDFGDVYGKSFDFLTKEKPVSVLLAEGSPIKVMSGTLVV